MELLVFFALSAVLAWLSFWFAGQIYGLVHRPPVVFPARLALSMAAAGIGGVIFAGIGGVVLAAWLMNRSFQRRDDYRPLPTWVAGILVAAVASAATLLGAYALAWQILD